MFSDFVRFAQELYYTGSSILLPTLKSSGNEKKYLLEAIDLTFVYSKLLAQYGLTQDKQQGDQILKATNNSDVMTLLSCTPLIKLTINQNCQCGDLRNTEWVARPNSEHAQ